MSINGALVFTSGLAPGQNDFDYTSVGAAAGATNGTDIEFNFFHLLIFEIISQDFHIKIKLYGTRKL